MDKIAAFLSKSYTVFPNLFSALNKQLMIPPSPYPYPGHTLSKERKYRAHNKFSQFFPFNTQTSDSVLCT